VRLGRGRAGEGGLVLAYEVEEVLGVVALPYLAGVGTVSVELKGDGWDGELRLNRADHRLHHLAQLHRYMQTRLAEGILVPSTYLVH
jgi:hypothetical protein